MEVTKRNHVVPREYLRWFRVSETSNSRAAMVWMYDRVSRKWTLVPVQDAGVRKNFYHGEDEVGLADQVEQPAQGPLEKLRSGLQIDSEERLKVAWYVYAMMTRVPAARELARRTVAQDSELWIKQIIEDARAVYRIAGLPVPEGVEDQLGEMVAGIEADPTELPFDLYDDIVKRVLYDSEIGGPPETAKILARLAWRVVFTGRQQKFLTSDNPVHVFPLSLGLDDPLFELVMPLSSECSLHISRQGSPDMLEFTEVDQRLARNLNMRVVSRAERFVFSSRQERWVGKTMRRSPRQFRLTGITWGHDQFIRGFNRGATCDKCGEVFTTEELDTTEVTYRGENAGDELKVERVKTIWHACPG